MTHFLSLLQHSSPPKSGSGVDHKKIVMLPNTTATVLDPPTPKTHRPTHTHTHTNGDLILTRCLWQERPFGGMGSSR